jgi:hypothetical protein
MNDSRLVNPSKNQKQQYLDMIEKLQNLEDEINDHLEDVPFECYVCNHHPYNQFVYTMDFDTDDCIEMFADFLRNEGVCIDSLDKKIAGSEEVHVWSVRFPFDPSVVWKIDARYHEEDDHGAVYFRFMKCKLWQHSFKVFVNGTGVRLDNCNLECPIHLQVREHVSHTYFEQEAHERSIISRLSYIFT